MPGITDPRKSSLLDNAIFPTDTDLRVRSRENDVNGFVVRAFIE